MSSDRVKNKRVICKKCGGKMSLDKHKPLVRKMKINLKKIRHLQMVCKVCGQKELFIFKEDR